MALMALVLQQCDHVLFRICIEQIDDVVEEEEDEATQTARLDSHAEASTSEAKVGSQSHCQRHTHNSCLSPSHA